MTVVLSVFAVACGDVQGGAEQGDDVAGSTVDSADELRAGSRFETFTGADGQTYFHLVAKNGQIVLRSEGYTRMESAKTGMNAVLALGADLSNFDVQEASNGDYYFSILATNGQSVGLSQLYSTRSNALRGARAVQTVTRAIAAPAASREAPKRERFETFTGEDGDVYFHLRANNGEIVLASEGYSRKASALTGIASVETSGVDSDNFEVFETARGYAIRLVASNGKVVARGETYATKSSATRAVRTISAMLTRGVSIAP